MTLTTPDMLLFAGIAAGSLPACSGARRRGVTLWPLALASLLCATGAGVGVVISTIVSAMSASAPHAVWYNRGESHLMLVCASALAAAWYVLHRINLARLAGVMGPALLLGLLDGTLPGSLPCHPVQLYEAGTAALAALRLAFCVPRRAVPRCTIGLACGVYGSLRFLLEFLRADHPAFWCGLTHPQITSLALVAAGGAIVIAGRYSVVHTRECA